MHVDALKKYWRAAGERSHAVKVEDIISRRVFGAERRTDLVSVSPMCCGPDGPKFDALDALELGRFSTRRDFATYFHNAFACYTVPFDFRDR